MLFGSNFGNLYKVSTFGESHGRAVGVVIDGVPPNFPIDLEQISKELGRRKPGQSKLVTQRKEEDSLEVFSGIFEGKTTGAPIMALVFNQDQRSKDYSDIKDLFRPGHADFPYFTKYKNRDYRGGGRSSARETIGRVIAGAIAKQILAKDGISFRAGIVQVGKVKAQKYDWQQVEDNDVKSVDPDSVSKMIDEIEAARKDRDSIGAVLEVQALGLKPGLGEPVFARLDAAVAAAMISIPAAKGVEIGSGFSSVSKRGSENNDLMSKDGFLSNNHGGVLGGISSGAPLVARVAFKPTSSIAKEQQTIDTDFNEKKISTKGRHDPCVALRAAPIAEAMMALVVIDFWLQDLAYKKASSFYAENSSIDYGMKK